MGMTNMEDALSDDLTASIADAVAAAATDRQFVTFTVANEMFAVPMAPVQEIIRVPEVARMPLTPHALDGLANLRGRVLPIVNLRRLFQVEERPLDDATRALVINLGQPLGFVVDHVASVLNIEPSEIEPATAIQSVVQAEYLTGVINRKGPDGLPQLMLVLDFERLIAEQFRQATHMGRAGSSAASVDAVRSDTAADGASADERRLVSFTVQGQEYAIDIAVVQEIVQIPSSITAVPNTPRHVLGLMSLRQRLLPLVSLRSLFGMPDAEASEQQRIVVVELPGGGQVGLVTDTVKEVLTVPRHLTEPVPAVLAHGQELDEFESICRLDDGKRLVSIIATDKLLGMQALADAASIAGAAGHDPAMNPQESEMNRLNSQSREQATDDDAQVVIFRLGAEEFGVPIMSVQEIVRVPDVLTRVPKTPKFVEGVINLRGTVLPVVDQRTRLGMSGIERNDRQRIMVYTLGGQRTGFIVDSVAEVLRISRSHIEVAPDLSDEQGRLITQVAKLDNDRRLVMLIDPDQLLGSREIKDMAGMSLHKSRSVDAEYPPLAKAA
jgi:purine-binding chemotaxis protein CheW